MSSETTYVKDQWYDEGKYLGIVDTYPWGKDHFIRNHHFMEAWPVKNRASKINQIFIEKIKRGDK